MFTIIIPTHDRPYLLHRTLISLARQTFRDFTVIIVSDSGKYIAPYEGLAALPGHFLYILRNDQPGPAESRNLAIDLVKADYAIFLDDDDTFEETHLESLAAAIGSSKPDILYCDFKVVEENRTTMPPQRISETVIQIPGATKSSVFVNNMIPNSCLVYSQSVLKSFRYDPSLILFEDWDYLLGCLKHCRDLPHVPVSSVLIHKSYLAGEENVRRGNVNNDRLVDTTLEIYRRHPAPDQASRLLRQKRFEEIGLKMPIECF